MSRPSMQRSPHSYYEAPVPMDVFSDLDPSLSPSTMPSHEGSNHDSEATPVPGPAQEGEQCVRQDEVDSDEEDDTRTDAPALASDHAEAFGIEYVSTDTAGTSSGRRQRSGAFSRGSSVPSFSSPLSSDTPLRRTTTTTTRHPRHNYTHRGHSLSSFIHYKSFWLCRRESWWAHAEQHDTAGLSAHTHFLTVTPALQMPYFDEPPTPGAPEPVFDTNGIYPRMGDLRALRDDHCATVDYCFCAFPPWTIQKALFVWDALHLSNTMPAEDVAPPEEGEDGSVCHSPDATLVADDFGHAKEKAAPAGISEYGDKGWYRRWQVLLDLLGRKDGRTVDTLSHSISTAISASLSAESDMTVGDVVDLLDKVAEEQPLRAARRVPSNPFGREMVQIRFGEEHDETEEWWEEESEDDYGVLLSAPAFARVAEEYLENWGGGR